VRERSQAGCEFGEEVARGLGETEIKYEKVLEFCPRKADLQPQSKKLVGGEPSRGILGTPLTHQQETVSSERGKISIGKFHFPLCQ
jgi:hypothetical protein